MHDHTTRVRDLLTPYEAALRGEKRRERGIERYIWSMDRFIRWADDAVTVQDVDAPLLRTYQAESLSACSNSFVQSEISVLRHFCRWCQAAGLRDDNPAQAMVYPRRRRTLPKALSSDELDAVLQVVTAPATTRKLRRNHLAILVALYTGVRLAELAALRWSDIDLAAETLIVRAEGGKFGREREIPLHPQLVAALRTVPAVERLPDMALLQKPDGSPLAYRSVEHIFDRWLRRRTGNRQLSAHRFRHTFATLLLNANVHIRRIQKLMGHSDLDTTAMYLQLVDAEDRDAVARISIDLATVPQPGPTILRFPDAAQPRTDEEVA